MYSLYKISKAVKDQIIVKFIVERLEIQKITLVIGFFNDFFYSS